MPSYINVHGSELAYEVKGEGEKTLILLNGVAMTMAHWLPFIDSLTGSYRIVLHDFKGQLLSDKPEEEYSLAGHADDLSRLMDSLEIGKAHLIGTSYGSEVAMEFALLYPRKVESLTLIDGVSEIDSLLESTIESWQMTARADPALFYRTIIPWNYSSGYIESNRRKLQDREEAVKKLPRQYFEAFIRLCSAFLKIDLTSRLKRISVPVLVLVAEKDILKHIGFARIIEKEIPNSRLEVIPGAGHAVVIEEPGKIAGSVESFLLQISD